MNGAIVRLTLRQVRRSAIVVVVVTGGMTALVAGTYRSVVTGPPERAQLAAIAGNRAIRTLFGTPSGLGDPGGFTVWRTGTVLALILGGWGVLVMTRISRGEEQSGRWDLLLSGRTTVSGVLGRQVAVLLTVMAAVWVVVAAGLLTAGVRGAALHATGLALVGAAGVATAAGTAQLFASRAAATGVAAGLLGVGLLLRMVADGFAGLAWLRWLTPLGLVELSEPFGPGRWLPLLTLAVANATPVGLAGRAGRWRDVRGARLGGPGRRRPSYALLGSPAAFALRRARLPIVAWSLGMGAFYLLIGLVAGSVTDLLRDNPRLAELAEQGGATGLGTPAGYAATLFVLLTMPAGGFVASRLAAFIGDEVAGRHALACAGPVPRWRWLGAEMLAAGTGALVLALVAAVALWAGGSRLGPAAALAGAANVLPVVALSLGAAVLAVGVAPRAVALLGAIPTIGGFLLVTLGEAVRMPGRLLTLSPYTHLAPVPARSPDLPAAAVMIAFAVLACTAGTVAYRRRDLGG
ncbi:hypothetical protein [Paractinoplanes durhamensis]|uniref:hypothetical protein n=1 Tax=Paractinoplanes durhamensis TaxID=113563 RepID=UPI0031DC476D